MLAMISGNAFWLLSAVVQSSAALMGLTIAAYIFLWQLFDHEDDPQGITSDETAELFRAIRAWFHGKILIILLSLSISVALGVFAMIWLPDQKDRMCLGQAVLALGSVASFLFSAGYIVYIFWRYLNADLRTRIASELAAPLGQPPSPSPPATAGEFIDAFIELETLIRDASKDLDVPQGRVPLRSIVDALKRQEVLSARLAHGLDELFRYRNLVVHGEIREVPRENVDWVSSTTDLVRTELTAGPHST